MRCERRCLHGDVDPGRAPSSWDRVRHAVDRPRRAPVSRASSRRGGPRVRAEGGCIVHSTLTHALSRVARAHADLAHAPTTNPYGRFEAMSLLEPQDVPELGHDTAAGRSGGTTTRAHEVPRRESRVGHLSSLLSLFTNSGAATTRRRRPFTSKNHLPCLSPLPVPFPRPPRARRLAANPAPNSAREGWRAGSRRAVSRERRHRDDRRVRSPPPTTGPIGAARFSPSAYGWASRTPRPGRFANRGGFASPPIARVPLRGQTQTVRLRLVACHRRRLIGPFRLSASRRSIPPNARPCGVSRLSVRGELRRACLLRAESLFPVSSRADTALLGVARARLGVALLTPEERGRASARSPHPAPGRGAPASRALSRIASRSRSILETWAAPVRHAAAPSPSPRAPRPPSSGRGQLRGVRLELARRLSARAAAVSAGARAPSSRARARAPLRSTRAAAAARPAPPDPDAASLSSPTLNCRPRRVVPRVPRAERSSAAVVHRVRARDRSRRANEEAPPRRRPRPAAARPSASTAIGRRFSRIGSPSPSRDPSMRVIIVELEDEKLASASQSVA